MASLEPSYFLRALGLEEDMAHTSIRFGFRCFTTEAEMCVGEGGRGEAWRAGAARSDACRK